MSDRREQMIEAVRAVMSSHMQAFIPERIVDALLVLPDPEIDKDRLNNAKWAARNRRYPEGTPSMEWCSELAENVVCAYLGIDADDWRNDEEAEKLVKAIEDDKSSDKTENKTIETLQRELDRANDHAMQAERLMISSAEREAETVFRLRDLETAARELVNRRGQYTEDWNRLRSILDSSK